MKTMLILLFLVSFVALFRAVPLDDESQNSPYRIEDLLRPAAYDVKAFQNWLNIFLIG